MNEDIDIFGWVDSIDSCDEVDELSDGVCKVILFVECVNETIRVGEVHTYVYVKEEENSREVRQWNAKIFYRCITWTVPELKRYKRAVVK